MSYAEIDRQIVAWAAKHKLLLSIYWEGGELRSAHVSSIAGECFQIWIEYPVGRLVAVHADCVEGRREDLEPQNWMVDIDDIERTLEEVFQTVSDWMAPSTRYLPEAQFRSSFDAQ